MEAVLNVMAEDLAVSVGVIVDDVEFQEPEFGGLLVGVVPSVPGQLLPAALEGLDDLIAWEGAGGLGRPRNAPAGRHAVFADGPKYRVWSHHPTGFEIERISDGANAFLQGEDAVRLEDELEAALRAHEQGSLKADPVDHVAGDYDEVLSVGGQAA